MEREILKHLILWNGGSSIWLIIIPAHFFPFSHVLNWHSFFKDTQHDTNLELAKAIFENKYKDERS